MHLKEAKKIIENFMISKSKGEMKEDLFHVLVNPLIQLHPECKEYLEKLELADKNYKLQAKNIEISFSKKRQFWL